MNFYGEIATATVTGKKYEKMPRYAAKNENYSKNRPENRKMGLYEPGNAIIRPIFRFSGLTGMKFRKNNESVEQGVPGYDPQVAAMHWPSLAAKVYTSALGRA